MSLPSLRRVVPWSDQRRQATTHHPRCEDAKENNGVNERTNHSYIEYLKCLRSNCPEKPVKENRMEQGAQDLTGVLAIKDLYTGSKLITIIVCSKK
jgi:hypothetical protein